jgi:hypothetical protein
VCVCEYDCFMRMDKLIKKIRMERLKMIRF